ncbi:MAG: tyrosine-type recombinase/integrase [Marmoricola sp.]
MSPLGESLEDYLTIRRALGYKLETQGRMLADFVAFADAAGARNITTDLALAWALLPPAATPGWAARRLRVVQGFARYLHTIEPATEVPPAGLLAGRNHRPTPYLYSDEEVCALLSAARTLSPPLRAATVGTVIGLLAVSGLRIGEAIRLDRNDVDWTNDSLLVRDSKFGNSRLVPLHPSTLDALRAYSILRDQLCPQPLGPSFFVSTRGARLAHATIYWPFRELLALVGLESGSPGRWPRLHDFRHSLAVKTLVDWYRGGEDVAARMPSLSTYLGHLHPAATYWYLSAAPELLRLASDRLEQAQARP